MSKLREKLAAFSKVANEEQEQLIVNLQDSIGELEQSILAMQESANKVFEISKKYGGDIEKIVGESVYDRFNIFVQETYRGVENFSFDKINRTIEDERSKLSKMKMDSVHI